MGSVAYYREPGQSDLEHLRAELTTPGTDPSIIAGATVRNVFYGAFRIPDGRVIGLVVLQSRYRTRDGMNYGRKEMTEDMGPCESRCPARILDMLSDPPENEYAADWRARCRANLERSAAQPAIRTGARFRVSEPWTFRDEISEDTFDVIDARRRIFARAGDGRRVRLPAKSSWPTFHVTFNPMS